MIVGSLLLILVAVGLLVGGVVGGSNTLIVCCIIAAVLAAIVLVVGVKQSADADPTEADEDDEAAAARESRARGRAEDTSRGRESGRRSAAGGTSYGSRERAGTLVEERTSIPTQTPFTDEAPTERRPTERIDIGARTETFDRYREEPPPPPAVVEAPAVEVDYDDEDPPDEPSAQIVSPQQAARVAMLSADVLVVDGRPRYHVSGCVHLLGRESEPLPVGEAVELGFTPCGLCEPDSKLLADARRV